MVTLAAEDVWSWLEDVKDPEVPVLSVVELGIVRDVRVADGTAIVTITPTYSGCPAMHEIEQEIVRALGAHGVDRVRLETVYAPAWTTDWIGDAGKAKLAAYGIAPPRGVEAVPNVVSIQSRRAQRAAPVPCPFCGSHDSELRAEFGATACKAIHYCRSCQQPFEEFKPF
ncbi:MAG: 1,2-phenylacetyl-CoA epoxidase subunit PaaD [Gemmatimonadaceae bacterium]